MTLQKRGRLWTRFFLALIVAFSLSIVSCSGGSGSGGTSSPSGSNQSSPALGFANPVDLVTPAYGSAVRSSDTFEITIHNGDPIKYRGGEYTISVHGDSSLSQLLETSEVLSEDADKNVKWTPSLVTLSENSELWWKWSVVYNTDEGAETFDVDPFVVYIVKDNSAEAFSPRNGKYMDMNMRLSPMFAVNNALSNSSVNITYDFELYRDNAMTDLVVSVAGVSQDNAENYTAWVLEAELLRDSTYYWRSRAVFNGVPLKWVGLNSFTVRNPCEISGAPNAQNSFEWKVKGECPSGEHTDPSKSFGYPNATGDGTAGNPYKGFMSIGFGGVLGLETGATVIDGAGNDIRLYEYVSIEPLEVFVGMSEAGPWISLGVQWCPDYCDFDLARAGVRYGRFFRIRDLDSPAGICHATSGSDVDAMVWLAPISSPNACEAGWE